MKKNHLPIGINFALMAACQLASRVTAFVATVHLARTLGADGLGLILLCISALSFGVSFVDFGLSKLGAVEIGRTPDSLASLVSNIVAVRIVIIVIGLIVTAVVLHAVPISDSQKSLATIYLISLFATIFDISWVFIGSRWMVPGAISDISAQVLYTSFILMVVHQPSQIVIVPVIYLLSKLIETTIMLSFFVSRFGVIWDSIDLKKIKELIVASSPLAATGLLILVLTNFSLLATGIWLGASFSGLYGVATRVTAMLSIAMATYFTLVSPLLAKAQTRSKACVDRAIGESVDLTMTIAIAASAGGAITAGPIVSTLFGHDYMTTVPVMRLLFVAFCLRAFNRNYRTLLISTGQQGLDFKLMSLAALFTVASSVFFIARMGIVGAAVAVLLTEALMALTYLIAVNSWSRDLRIIGRLWKPVCCGSIMSVAVFSISSLHLAAQVLLGVSVYAIALLLLRGSSPKEMLAFLTARGLERIVDDESFDVQQSHSAGLIASQ